jgi:N,N'-diacetyllegionaminate synthase
MYGSDAQHSLEPNEFEQMVEGIRAAEIMLGTKTDKDAIATRMREMKEVFEKSVVAIVDIPAEALITADMVALKKPGTGIPARCLNDVIGARTRQFVPKDTVLQEAYLYA